MHISRPCPVWYSIIIKPRPSSKNSLVQRIFHITQRYYNICAYDGGAEQKYKLKKKFTDRSFILKHASAVAILNARLIYRFFLLLSLHFESVLEKRFSSQCTWRVGEDNDSNNSHCSSLCIYIHYSEVSSCFFTLFVVNVVFFFFFQGKRPFLLPIISGHLGWGKKSSMKKSAILYGANFESNLTPCAPPRTSRQQCYGIELSSLYFILQLERWCSLWCESILLLLLVFEMLRAFMRI